MPGGSTFLWFVPGLISVVRTKPGCVQPLEIRDVLLPAGHGVPSMGSAQSWDGDPPDVLACALVPPGPLGHVPTCFK